MTSHHNYLPVKTHYFIDAQGQKKRRVRVLLPKNYEQNMEKNYPVVYMQDGQNVLYSKEAYSGHSWKLIPLLKHAAKFPDMLIVAIDNAGEERFNEYTPWMLSEENQALLGYSGGEGQAYSEWVVTVIKPFIDEHYRTKSDRRNTLCAGSSLGGLIVAYMGSAYPEVFGALGIFSLASWISEEEFLDFVANHPLKEDTKVYIQVGTAEGNEVDQALLAKNSDQAYIDSSLWYYQTLIRQGQPMDSLWLRILADEQHFEKYWADHFGEFLAFGFSTES
jgi:predicted alpha/beta superfamily hydrolase